jgi:hypothetical protein
MCPARRRIPIHCFAWATGLSYGSSIVQLVQSSGEIMALPSIPGAHGAIATQLIPATDAHADPVAPGNASSSQPPQPQGAGNSLLNSLPTMPAQLRSVRSLPDLHAPSDAPARRSPLRRISSAPAQRAYQAATFLPTAHAASTAVTDQATQPETAADIPMPDSGAARPDGDRPAEFDEAGADAGPSTDNEPIAAAGASEGNGRETDAIDGPSTGTESNAVAGPSKFIGSMADTGSSANVEPHTSAHDTAVDTDKAKDSHELGIEDINSLLPRRGPAGPDAAGFAYALGLHQKGLAPTGFMSKKPINSVVSAASAGVHGHFTYDSVPLTDFVNGIGAVATTIGTQSVHSRYEAKLKDMLKQDSERFIAAAGKAEAAVKAERELTIKGVPNSDAKAVAEAKTAWAKFRSEVKADDRSTAYSRFETMTDKQREQLRIDPTLPDNQILTKVGKQTKIGEGQWQYDLVKLTRIAGDDSHPLSQHARTVLTAMSIEENTRKRRNGALYQVGVSSMALGGAAALIAGSHGAITPALASGHAIIALKEALDLKKPFVESRQIMRNQKQREIQRIVNHGLFNQTVPKNAPQEAGGAEYTPQEQAGVYAAMYDNARLSLTKKTGLFGPRLVRTFLPGGLINAEKSQVHKDATQSIVTGHIVSMISKGIEQVDDKRLSALVKAETEPGMPDSEHEKRALKAIELDPNLKAAHTLLTDTGIPKGKAAMLLALMSIAEENTRKEAKTATEATQNVNGSLPESERLSTIADLIGQPALKPPKPEKEVESALKKGIGLRT